MTLWRWLRPKRSGGEDGDEAEPSPAERRYEDAKREAAAGMASAERQTRRARDVVRRTRKEFPLSDWLVPPPSPPANGDGAGR